MNKDNKDNKDNKYRNGATLPVGGPGHPQGPVPAVGQTIDLPGEKDDDLLGMVIAPVEGTSGLFVCPVIGENVDLIVERLGGGRTTDGVWISQPAICLDLDRVTLVSDGPVFPPMLDMDAYRALHVAQSRYVKYFWSEGPESSHDTRTIGVEIRETAPARGHYPRTHHIDMTDLGPIQPEHFTEHRIDRQDKIRDGNDSYVVNVLAFQDGALEIVHVRVSSHLVRALKDADQHWEHEVSDTIAHILDCMGFVLTIPSEAFMDELHSEMGVFVYGEHFGRFKPSKTVMGPFVTVEDLVAINRLPRDRMARFTRPSERLYLAFFVGCLYPNEAVYFTECRDPDSVAEARIIRVIRDGPTQARVRVIHAGMGSLEEGGNKWRVIRAHIVTWAEFVLGDGPSSYKAITGLDREHVPAEGGQLMEEVMGKSGSELTGEEAIEGLMSLFG